MELSDFQSQYGVYDGLYWWAVREYEKEGGDGEPHRIASKVTKTYVILYDVNGERLGRYDAKQSKRAKDGKSKGDTPEPEKLEDSPDEASESVRRYLS